VYWWCSPDAEPYTIERLARLGFNGDFANPVFTADPNPQTKGIVLVCRYEIFKNREHERWDVQMGAQEHQSWTQDRTREFKARYETALRAQRSPGGAPAPAPAPAPVSTPAAATPPPDNSPPRDDEVPGVAAPGDVLDVKDDEIPF